MNSGLIDEYNALYAKVLVPVAASLSELIADHLCGLPRIDRVSARAKQPERFAEKAQRHENGALKYESPLTQIQDQIGARVVVFYPGDVEAISVRLLAYFRPIEEQLIVPDSHWAFGYFGKHYILALPADVVPSELDRSLAPRFFELQVKTLFQHAWAEAEHDIGYKPGRALTSDQERRFAYAAAQAWGADHIFDSLSTELLR